MRPGLGLVLGAGCELVAQQRLPRLELFAGGAAVDGADRDLEQVALERVEAVGVAAGLVVAHQQRVQPDQVGDLLRRRPRRVLDVPGVDRVLVVGGADREVAGRPGSASRGRRSGRRGRARSRACRGPGSARG